MITKKVTCGSCRGTGRHYIWRKEHVGDMTGLVLKEEGDCIACKGKGYLEYATFSVEEAKAILKHCGLNVESEK